MINGRVGNACHMDMSGIMAHSGFGALIIRNSNYEVIVPQNGINAEGFVKKSWRNRINRMTLDDAEWLYKRGGEVHLAA